MQQLSVIPTPPGQKWREFRVRFLPIVVFSGTILAIFFLWTGYISPPTLVAQVEPLIAEVKSFDDGVLTNLFVERYQAVKAGDPIAAVISSENRRLDAQLQLLRSQISLAQLQLGTLVDRDRLAFDYHGLKTDVMRQQTELEIAKAQLPAAEFEMNRARQLREGSIVSEAEFLRLASVYESLQAQIKQLSSNVVFLEKQLESSRALGEFRSNTETAEAVQKSLLQMQEQNRKLEQIQTEPIVLRAPIDGIVSTIHRRAGETLMAGELIVTISAQGSERLVGYLSQPLPFNPEVGMPVRLRTRSGRRAEADSVIARIGSQFEVITNVALIHPSMPPQLGLPLAITIPASLQPIVRPGEVIDVTLRKR
jgi:multidrug resistance efflux pump